MTVELYDTATFDGSIGNGSSEQLEVQTSKANYVQVLVDNGTTGGTPGSYDIVVEYYSTAADDYMQVDNASGSTDFAPSIEESARGQSYRITITNQSGASANFRISLEAFTEI